MAAQAIESTRAQWTVRGACSTAAMKALTVAQETESLTVQLVTRAKDSMDAQPTESSTACLSAATKAGTAVVVGSAAARKVATIVLAMESSTARLAAFSLLVGSNEGWDGGRCWIGGSAEGCDNCASDGELDSSVGGDEG